MVRIFIYQEGNLIMIRNNKGNTIVDMLVITLIVMACMCLTLRRNININCDHYDFMNEYLLAQVNALRNRENVLLDYDSSIYFNESGHVNRAGTYYFDNHKVISHIGNGYLTYE